MARRELLTGTWEHQHYEEAILTKQGLTMNRCVLCGKYPELCYRYVRRNGIFSAVWCINREHDVEHEIRLIGTSVEGLVASWNKLNERRD